MSFGEFTRLITCIFLDVVEYIIPFLLTPLVGDFFDVVGLITCLYLFRWTGLVALLELVPGLDPVPINILTWSIWIINKRLKKLPSIK